NHTFPTKDSLYSLVYTVNSSLKDARLSEAVLQKCFNAFYPQFEEEFAKIMKNTVEAKIEERQPPEILGEVLSSVREMEKRMRNLENESLRSMAKLESMILQNSNRVITFGDFNEKPKFTLDFLNKSINFDDTNNLFTSGSQSTPPNS
ncbi:MAG TPA: hypothetical protein VG101_17670, partial [Puia sp.]|nr:hypothetical protein [Puia sp.]